MKTAALLLSACSLAIGGGGGYLVGAGRVAVPDVAALRLLTAEEPAVAEDARPPGTGSVIYYRHPDGDPAWSAGPAKTPDGRDYLPVWASEDVNLADKPEGAKPGEKAEGEQPDVNVAETGSAGASASGRKILYYRNPMGLPDTSKVPKKDSMGMDYVPVYEGEAEGGSTVRVPLGKLQRTGVRTADVTMESLPTTLRVPGVVILDDRRIHTVSMRSDSFVEDVAPVTAGSRVKAGETLFRFYSKDVATAASEYANVVSGGGDTAGSALRLRNLGMSDRMVEAIRRDRKVPSSISFDAPVDGIVVERSTTPGSMAEPGDVLFRIADIREVWMVADVPESQLAAVAVGAEATVAVGARPGATVRGVVELVEPEIREQTRTARVRIRLPNPDGGLLPNMFGNVEIATGRPDPVISVPNDAIVDTGSRRVVFIDKGEGRFEPRDVEVGVRAAQRTEVTSGLAAGERVVVAANFLLDAESNLNSALNALAAEDAQP
ncbi:efflux RND transporter periplasmic adaptor subunit [Agrobacterium tumefaciens]|nr:efflux RND transporter periplasmic adaptor subunit [Agrobacterium tumefaciens]